MREAGGDPWDLRNALDIGATCGCHEAHHAALKDGRPWRIPLSVIPPAAFEFAVELLGGARAGELFRRFYGAEGTAA